MVLYGLTNVIHAINNETSQTEIRMLQRRFIFDRQRKTYANAHVQLSTFDRNLNYQ